MILHPNLKSFYHLPNRREYAISLLKSEVDKLLDSIIVHTRQETTLNNKEKNKVKKYAFDELVR